MSAKRNFRDVIHLRNLALEAADALWALAKGKTPDWDPITINQDIHKLRPVIDAAFSAAPSMSEDCPLCQRDIAINTEVGKGWELLARKRR